MKILCRKKPHIPWRKNKIMAKEIQPKDTTRAAAYELWMKAPNPMVTFFKTLDVTNLMKISRRKHLKFHMLMNYCIGRAAAGIREFYILPVGLDCFDGPACFRQCKHSLRITLCNYAELFE